MEKTIVTSQWLQTHLSDPELIILDASQQGNISGLEAEHEGIQIKGARFFDLKGKFTDTNARFPNTLPSAQDFEREAQKLGINASSKLVVYDKLGIYSSPRVWWMFRAMGHEQVAVLNGGLPEWIAQGYETEAIQEKEYELGNFKAKLQADQVKDFQFVKSNTEKQDYLVIDARSAGRFAGTAPEPRKGLRSGSIPNSINIPFQEVLVDGKLKAPEELKTLFEEAITSNKPLIFSCGSGLTACILHLASELVSTQKKAVYDGSWTEWAQLEV